MQALQPARSPRRLLIALALGVLVAGGIGAAAVAAEPQTTPDVVSFTVPVARIGDRGTYKGSHVILAGQGTQDAANLTEEDTTRSDFEWRQGTLMADSSGRLVATDLLVLGDTFYWIERGTQHLVARQIGANVQPPPGDGVPILDAMQGHRLGRGISYCWVETFSNTFLNSLMGTTVRSDASIHIYQEAPSCVGTWPTGNVSYEFDGVETINGVETTRWSHTAHGMTWAVWLAPGIPYPIRTQGNFIYGHTSGLTYGDLIAYAPGSAPRGAAEAPIPAPKLEYLARTPWGMDDTGVDHPFPLSKAYQLTLAAPDFPQLRDFVSSHANVYTYSANYVGRFVDGREIHTWSFGVTNGTVALVVTANETLPRLQGLNQPWPLGLSGQPTYGFAEGRDGGTGFVGWQVYEGREGYRHFPSLAELPANVPKVSDLLARWERYAAGYAPFANGWGFSTGQCEQDCAHPRNYYWLAYHVVDDRQNTVDPQNGRIPGAATYHAWEASWLLLNATGRADFMQISRNEFGGVPGTGFTPATGPTSNGVPPADKPTTIRGATTWTLWPSPQAAASFGLLGLLAGALYYFGPALKSAGLAMFSRLRSDEVLDHPSRRRILDAVTAQPGIHFNGLLRMTELPNGTLVHHLRALVNAGHVAERPLGGYTCYFAGTPTRAAVAAAPALKADGARRVLEAVRSAQGLSNLAIAQATGLAPSVVHTHVQKLASAGLVDVARDGRSLVVRAAAA